MGPGGGVVVRLEDGPVGTHAAGSGAERLRVSTVSHLVDVGVIVKVGKVGLRFERAGSSGLLVSISITWHLG